MEPKIERLTERENREREVVEIYEKQQSRGTILMEYRKKLTLKILTEKRNY